MIFGKSSLNGVPMNRASIKWMRTSIELPISSDLRRPLVLNTGRKLCFTTKVVAFKGNSMGAVYSQQYTCVLIFPHGVVIVHMFWLPDSNRMVWYFMFKSRVVTYGNPFNSCIIPEILGIRNSFQTSLVLTLRKSDIIRTISLDFGIIKVGLAHCKFDSLFSISNASIRQSSL